MASTLDDCVRSIIACCGVDAQIILVDDGSPDECPRLCDEWSKQDKRIQVVHRYNGGLSAARNCGLQVADGEWVTFVDSDDIVAFDFSLCPVDDSTIDIVEYPVRRHYQTDNEELLQWGERDFMSAVDYWQTTQGWKHSYAWNKIYRRTLFNGIRFPEGRVFEDIWTIPALLRKARTIRTVVDGWYGYCDNPKGITCTAGGTQLMDLLQGNINSLRELGVCDVRHYADILNIQLDVYRLTGRVMLQKRHFSFAEMRKLSFVSRFKMLLSVNLICKIHKWIVRR